VTDRFFLPNFTIMSDTHILSFSEKRILGRSELKVGCLGFGSSYGAPAKAYEKAFERGLNYFYWGSMRRKGMGQAIRSLAPRHRENLVVALQTYSRFGTPLQWSVQWGLRKLKLDYADVLLLGWYNKALPERVMDAALSLKEKGQIRKIAISCHERTMFREFAKDPRIDILMVRYNAAHRGAESEVFPFLESASTGLKRPGLITYTTTRWKTLLKPRFTPSGEKTPTALDCYRFVLSNPNVDLCLSGPASEEEMDENLKLLDSPPMSSDEIAWMQKVGDRVHRDA
jgi:aryl-alcohol dehydrogenase-like predicted oxidoreductase